MVVTGLGLVTPLGIGIDENWQALMSGRSGIGPITHFDASSFPTRFAGEVRDFDPLRFIEKREVRRMDRFTHLAVAAAQLAVDDARIRFDGNAERVGVIVGVGMGGIETVEDGVHTFFESGLRRVTPFFIPRLIANMASAQIAIRFGVKGPNYATVSACAAGSHAIGEAYRLILHGYQDAMLTGGAEACVTPLGVGGFAVMKALSTRNDEPERASRPFDKGRDGFVVSEGSAVIVLEEAEAARARGAKVYAEVIGYAATGDAHHITSPAPEGEGAARCMRETLKDAQIDLSEVDYINAHGTSTPYNDANETQAIKHVFAEHAYRLCVSSTKSQTGHMLGAAGGVEAAYTALALHHQKIPATINYEEPDPECDLDYVPNTPRRASVRTALSNSFGFGGTNACLAFRAWK